MKVLWFSNTTANADEYFNLELKGTGGWLKSLDQLLQNKVELHIAFYSKTDKIFKYKDTFYHPIKTNQNLSIKIINKWLHFIPVREDFDKYIEIINQVNPDIIHIHGTERPFVSLIPYTNIPVVVSIQGNLTVILHKYFSGFEKRYLHLTKRKTNNIENLLFSEKFSTNYKFYKKIQKIEKKNFKFIRHFIGRTLWDNRISRIFAPGSNYYHVDEILRDSFYNNQWVPHFSDRIIIHTTNSNNIFKGFETLCMALNELNEIGTNCEWHVAGIGQDDLIVKATKKKLKNKFPQKGLVLMGSLNEKSLVEKLLQADIFVMTSHIENSPNNLSEAMILGMPCISTFVGGVGSLLRDGKEGILIQDGDPWVMAGAVLELANNREKAIQFGRKARTVAMQRHDKNKIVDNLLEIYTSIIFSNNK